MGANGRLGQPSPPSLAGKELGREAGGDEGVDQRVDMPPVLGFDHDIEFGAFDRGVVKQALMVHLDDIAAEPADDARDLRQDAGQVGQFGAQPH